MKMKAKVYLALLLIDKLAWLAVHLINSLSK